MKKFRLLSLLAAICVLASCNVAKQAQGAYNLINCKYDYRSISAISLSGMDLTKGVSLLNIPKITAILTGKPSSVPLDLTLNLDVTNPNQTEALLSGMQYILSIDDVQFTTGAVSQALNIAPGGKQTLPLNIGIDLVQLLSGDSRDAVVNITKNFIGIGDRKSEVKLQLRPTFMIGGHAVTSPVYIPVNFSFGGNK